MKASSYISAKKLNNKKLKARNIERDNIIVVEDITSKSIVYLWSYSSKCPKIYVSRINMHKNIIKIGNIILNNIKSWFHQVRVSVTRKPLQYDPFVN